MLVKSSGTKKLGFDSKAYLLPRGPSTSNKRLPSPLTSKSSSSFIDPAGEDVVSLPDDPICSEII